MTTNQTLDEVPPDHLEFVERLVFREFDEAYRRYRQEGLPVGDEVRAYEQALETITLVRKAREEDELDRITHTGTQMLDILDDSN